MGISLSKLFGGLFGSKKDYRILLLGLDAAGKTTLLYQLKLAELITTIPTIGFNVETVEFRNINMTIWDVGGQLAIRQLWKHYYENTQALIFVVDAADRARIPEAREELQYLLHQDELKDANLLVFSNKQDLADAMKTSEIIQALGLKNNGDRRWFVQPSSATTGDGVYDGMNWLVESLE